MGILLGARVGFLVGALEGILVGASLGVLVGSPEGIEVGALVGRGVGCRVGVRVGAIVGLSGSHVPQSMGHKILNWNSWHEVSMDSRAPTLIKKQTSYLSTRSVHFGFGVG